MNRVGMLVDCSHTRYRTTMDIMEAASQPMIFLHSNPKTLRLHGRNITDDQIRACAKTGSVIGVTGLGHFLPDRASPAMHSRTVSPMCAISSVIDAESQDPPKH
jgi:microsomal dipeptidase-like Zn-dependent dipeptidase